ncbi:MAG: peptidase U32 family protein [Planctomycetota bacterium]|jgi:putative protease
MHSKNNIRLNAPAGDLPSLIAAVDAGADSVNIGFRSPTNLRNLPGLNFSVEEAAEAVKYAHQHGVKVHLTVNTYPTDYQFEECFRSDVEQVTSARNTLRGNSFGRCGHEDDS